MSRKHYHRTKVSRKKWRRPILTCLRRSKNIAERVLEGCKGGELAGPGEPAGNWCIAEQACVDQPES